MKRAFTKLAAIMGMAAAMQPKEQNPFKESNTAPAPKKDDSRTPRYGRGRNQRQKRKLYRQVPQLRRSKHAELKTTR